jgi:hypothetical protein
MIKRFTPVFALACCIAALGISACGSSSSSSSSAASSTSAASASVSSGTKHFAKTKFVLHAGLAFGAFKHWIYNPVKAGDLKHPFSHKVTLIKAGLASAFVYHELKLAAGNVKSSKVLSTLFAPLTIAADKLKSLKSSLADGSVNPSEIDNLNSQFGQISSTASAHGQSITESVPSLSQLQAGSS